MRHETVYAVVRADLFQGEEVPLENKITVKKVVRALETAKTEVDRLNRLNADKGCRYFSQVTHFYPEVSQPCEDSDEQRRDQ